MSEIVKRFELRGRDVVEDDRGDLVMYDDYYELERKIVGLEAVQAKLAAIAFNKDHNYCHSVSTFAEFESPEAVIAQARSECGLEKEE